MSSSRTLIALNIFLLGCFVLAANAENVTATPKPVGSLEEDDSNLALEPLYTMTNTFMDVVFPNGIRVDTIRSVMDAVNSNQIEPWPLTQIILNGYYGFATCVVVGVLLLVLMPFIGCFCCCCRLCNKCGGKTQEQDPTRAKCKRIFCSGLLLVFTLITVGGMVMVFFSSARLYKLADDRILENQFQTEIAGLNQTIRTTVNEGIVDQTGQILDGLNDTVSQFLDDASNKLTGSFLNLSHVEQPVTELALVIDNVNETLESLIESMRAFEDLRTETALNFTEAQQLLNGLTSIPISSVAIQIQDLVTTIDGFSVADVIDDLNTGAKAQLAKIPNLREKYKSVNDTISGLIESKLNTSKSDIQQTVNIAAEGITDQVNSVATQILTSFNGVTSQRTAVSSDISMSSEYIKYGWYGCLALGSILAFITLLYLFGLMCGCGERPGEDANICNKGCGANFLLAAVGFTFIFYALLMLVTVIMFSVGSLISSHICWTIQKPNETVNALQFDDIAIPGLNLTFHTVIKAYSDCLDEKSIGEVVEPFEKELDFSKQTILDKLDTELDTGKFDAIIQNINISTTSFNFLPTDFNETITGLNEYSAFNSSSIPDLDSSVNSTKAKLDIVIGVLTTLGNGASGQDSQRWSEASAILQHSRDSGINNLATSSNLIRSEVNQMNAHLTQLKNASNDTFNAIRGAQEYIQTNGTQIVRQALDELMTTFAGTVKADASEGVDKIFGQKCDGIANQLKSTVDVFCITVLNPWNGLWFSLGWCLIMLIACMIIAVILTSLFRRTEPYDGDYKEDFHFPHRQNNPGFRDDYGRAVYSGGSRDMYFNGGGRGDRYGDQGPPPKYR